MRIYFAQHGLALSSEVDPNRPLSEEGRRDVQRIAEYLRKAEVTVTKVCHSDKLRTKETAEIFAGQIADGSVRQVGGMSPNDNVIEFAAGLKEDNTLYAGHLPHLGRLVSYLTAGDENAGVVEFVNGGVVCIEKDNTGYHIAWYLRPSLCSV